MPKQTGFDQEKVSGLVVGAVFIPQTNSVSLIVFTARGHVKCRLVVLDSQSVDLLLNSKTHPRLASSAKLEDCVKDFFGSDVPGEEGPGKGTKRKQKQTLTSASEGPEDGTGCRVCVTLRNKVALITTELEVAATSIGQLRKELAVAKKTPKVSAESEAPVMLRAANKKIASLEKRLARLDEMAETRGTQGCVSCDDLKKELDKMKVTMEAFQVYDQTVLGTLAASLVSAVGALRNNLGLCNVQDTKVNNPL